MFSLCVHLVGLYIYIIVLGWGIKGAAISTATAYSLNFIVSTAYVSIKKLVPKESWILPDKKAITSIPHFLKFGIPA